MLSAVHTYGFSAIGVKPHEAAVWQRTAWACMRVYQGGKSSRLSLAIAFGGL